MEVRPMGDKPPPSREEGQRKRGDPRVQAGSLKEDGGRTAKFMMLRIACLCASMLTWLCVATNLSNSSAKV